MRLKAMSTTSIWQKCRSEKLTKEQEKKKPALKRKSMNEKDE